MCFYYFNFFLIIIRMQQLRQKNAQEKSLNRRNLFRLRKENEAMKDRIITDIRNFFDQEREDYYQLVRVAYFGAEIILNMKAMEREIKHYQMKSISN